MDLGEIVNKIKFVIKTPGEFFKKYKSENDIKPAFTYFAFLSLLNMVLLVVSSFIFAKASPNEFFAYFSQDGVVLGFSYLIGLAFSIIAARISHLWFYLLKGKGSFKNTFQLLVYSQTPTLLLGFIPPIAILGWIYELVIFTRGAEVLHGFSRRKSILVVLIPRILLTAVFVLIAAYYSYLASNGMIK